MNLSLFILRISLILLQISMTLADDGNNSPMNTSSPSLLTSPSPTSSPSVYVLPGNDKCIDTPGWKPFESFRGCDADSLLCTNDGARENCCKCKSECSGQCPTNSKDFYQRSPNNRRFILICVLLFAIFLGVKRRKDRNQRRRNRYRATRSAQLRQDATLQTGQDVENNNGIFDAHRHERILSKFYFQVVLPDKSNINPESLLLPQAASSNSTNTRSKDDTSPEAEQESEDKPHPMMVIPSLLEVIFISSWASPSSRDECCICLDEYIPGETISMAKTPACKHLFHRDCVLEWVKTNDVCPLCRTDLIN
jgi:hypothetical protein